MALKLMYITNNPDVARIVDKYGTDMVFIDLETIGKEERQPGDTVKSHHTLNDISAVKAVLKKSKLLVRVNPIWENSEYEINTAINNGADILMLPYFKTALEVEKFISIVNGRAEVMLLLETREAAENLDSILEIPGIDRIHIGLNDLHLCYNMKFMFELLANGTVDILCEKIKAKHIPYGFGGIARLGEGAIPAEVVIKEHYRLGSDAAILSRSFCRCDEISDLNEIDAIFKDGIAEIRSYETLVSDVSADNFQKNHKKLVSAVNEIVNRR